MKSPRRKLKDKLEKVVKNIRFTGKKHKQKAKDLISEAITKGLTGKFGEKARAWKGDNASYSCKHRWIIKHFGKASKCSQVGCTSKNSKIYHWHNLSGKHLRTIDDYVELCPSCHGFITKGDYCKRGHEYTPQNTYWRKKGHRGCRVCKACRKINDKKRRLIKKEIR